MVAGMGRDLRRSSGRGPDIRSEVENVRRFVADGAEAILVRRNASCSEVLGTVSGSPESIGVAALRTGRIATSEVGTRPSGSEGRGFGQPSLLTRPVAGEVYPDFGNPKHSSQLDPHSGPGGTVSAARAGRLRYGLITDGLARSGRHRCGLLASR